MITSKVQKLIKEIQELKTCCLPVWQQDALLSSMLALRACIEPTHQEQEEDISASVEWAKCAKKQLGDFILFSGE